MKKAISFILLATFCLPLAAADQAERLSQALNCLKTQQGMNSHAFYTLGKLVTEQCEPALLAATNTASTCIFDESNEKDSIRSSALLLFIELVKANYEPSYEAAANSAASQSVRGEQNPVGLRPYALLLFSELVKANYKPSFSQACDAANDWANRYSTYPDSFKTRGIPNIMHIAYEAALELFYRLIQINYEPAFEPVINAAVKGMNYSVKKVRETAHELKALIEQKQGTRSRL